MCILLNTSSPGKKGAGEPKELLIEVHSIGTHKAQQVTGTQGGGLYSPKLGDSSTSPHLPTII